MSNLKPSAPKKLQKNDQSNRFDAIKDKMKNRKKKIKKPWNEMDESEQKQHDVIRYYIEHQDIKSLTDIYSSKQVINHILKIKSTNDTVYYEYIGTLFMSYPAINSFFYNGVSLYSFAYSTQENSYGDGTHREKVIKEMKLYKQKDKYQTFVLNILKKLQLTSQDWLKVFGPNDIRNINDFFGWDADIAVRIAFLYQLGMDDLFDMKIFIESFMEDVAQKWNSPYNLRTYLKASYYQQHGVKETYTVLNHRKWTNDAEFIQKMKNYLQNTKSDKENYPWKRKYQKKVMKTKKVTKIIVSDNKADNDDELEETEYSSDDEPFNAITLNSNFIPKRKKLLCNGGSPINEKLTKIKIEMWQHNLTPEYGMYGWM